MSKFKYLQEDQIFGTIVETLFKFDKDISPHEQAKFREIAKALDELGVEKVVSLELDDLAAKVNISTQVLIKFLSTPVVENFMKQQNKFLLEGAYRSLLIKIKTADNQKLAPLLTNLLKILEELQAEEKDKTFIYISKEQNGA